VQEVRTWATADTAIEQEDTGPGGVYARLEAAGHAPGFVRRPDILVARRGTDLLTARHVVLVVEVLSPGSVRTDNIVKRSEYADAGIRHYWIVDLTEPLSVLACHLAGGFGYADSGAVTGTFEAGEPFAVRLDLDAPR
jgi:Uma2 family endonuclease